MARSLVIVESPAKAKTLGRLLGPEFQVRASMGQVRDFPVDRMGVDTARGFEVEYEVLAPRRRILRELREAAREADTVYLATDPDREGEAVCWHLVQELAPEAQRRRFRRVGFCELTGRAVEEALRAPRDIDGHRVDAQQARRILDRLVGNSLNPLLWRAFRPGLSAGRVESVALRIVCDREREIERSVRRERWGVVVHLDAGELPMLAATLARIGTADAPAPSQAEVGRVCGTLETSSFTVASVVERQRRRPPAPPFTTSTLQQEAFRRLRFGVKKTMRLAQKLYQGRELGAEGPVGLLTYVRTDSEAIASEAVAAAREHAARVFGPAFVPAAPNVFRTPRPAQGACEAIRPTDVGRTPASLQGFLGKDELALYRLVYDRFLASQMAPAAYDEALAEIEARPVGTPYGQATHVLCAKGTRLSFSGFLAAHGDMHEGSEDGERGGILPPLREGQVLSLAKVATERQFTEPPPRFTEASLVKELERCGIGRPSTYAAILATLGGQGYVANDKSRLVPTPLGLDVCDLLVARFPELMSIRFNAAMEEELDAIAEARGTLLGTLTTFWRRFAPTLEAAAVVRPQDASGGSGVVSREATHGGLGRCPDCGAALALRNGRHGAFVGCSRYPACRYIQGKKATSTGVSCPSCDVGVVVEREANGRLFFGCSRYPACRFTSHHRIVGETCPECGRAYLLMKETKRAGRVLFCGNQSCHHRRSV